MACVAKRHRYSLPSVDRRARLQSPQKAWVTLVITPISPLAVGVAPALGGLAGRGGSSCTSGSALDALDDLGRGSTSSMRQPLVAPTSMYSMKRSTMPRALEVARHRQDFVLVGAALDDHVDLDRPQPRLARRIDAFEHIGDRKIHVVHAPEHRVVQAVQADRDALQPGGLQRLALRASSEPLVVSVRSSGLPSTVRSAASCSIRISRFLRSSGSPPVSRIFRRRARRTGGPGG